jgi:predicted dehydrogenase
MPTKSTALNTSRRGFLHSGLLAAAAATAPTILPSRVFGQDAPSKKITLGFIGMGRHGVGRNLTSFLNQPDAKVLAVCDVWKNKAESAKLKVDQSSKSNDCKAYQDFRKVLERDDIDAIVISTPDHWHVPLSMAALRAGKDVFSEKPTLTISEGRELVNEVTRRNAVFQWGIEDRYLIKYHRLAGWVRAGLIGDLESIHVHLPNKKPYLKDKPAAIPDGLDWNMWLGPAPFHPYTPTRLGPQNWRNIVDYSGGSLTDWGAHLVDTAQVGAGMDASGPVEVSGTARELDPETFQSNVPVNYKLKYRYANGAEMFVGDGKVNIKFVGSKGWVECSGWNGKWSASDPSIMRVKEFGAEANYWPRPEIEHRDFLDAIKARSKPAYHAEAGHRLATALHLGHLAIREGKAIRWDPTQEKFVDNGTELTKSIIYKRDSRDWENA